jgi:hypothetical protein
MICLRANGWTNPDHSLEAMLMIRFIEVDLLGL